MAFGRRYVASTLMTVLLAASSSECLASGTGLVLISNERSNNIIVIALRTSKVVKNVNPAGDVDRISYFLPGPGG